MEDPGGGPRRPPRTIYNVLHPSYTPTTFSVNPKSRNFQINWNATPTAPPNSEPTVSGPECLFPRFSEFPKEIRLMIWKFAIPGPRIVHVRSRRLREYRCNRVRSDISTSPSSNHKFFEPKDAVKQTAKAWRAGRYKTREVSPEAAYGVETDYSPPAMLLTCRESYEVACEVYCKAFADNGAITQVWFDFERDTLYIDHDMMLSILHGHWGYYRTHELGLDIFYVQNLAMSFEKEVYNHPINFGRYIFRDGDYPSSRHDVFDWFKPQLQSIKNFTIASSNFDTVDRSDIVYMDHVIGIKYCLNLFQKPYTLDGDLNYHESKAEIENEARMKAIQHELQLQLSGMLGFFIPQSGSVTVNRKFIATADFNASFTALKAEYAKKRAMFRRVYIMAAPGINPLPIAASWETTVGSMITKFRRARNISPEKEVSIRSSEKLGTMSPVIPIFQWGDIPDNLFVLIRSTINPSDLY